MVALLLLAAPVVTALVLAASVRVPSLVAALLVAYLALVAEVGLVTWALSPVDAVTRWGVAGAEAAVFAPALAVWVWRGRPRLPLAGAWDVARCLAADRLVLGFV